MSPDEVQSEVKVISTAQRRKNELVLHEGRRARLKKKLQDTFFFSAEVDESARLRQKRFDVFLCTVPNAKSGVPHRYFAGIPSINTTKGPHPMYACNLYNH